MIIAIIAMFIALGGTAVYAAKKIDGKSIKVKSIPGNRLKPRSVTAKQLSLGVLLGAESAQITGKQINEASLGQVPSAIHANTADTARSATDALTALTAVNAISAEKINGHSAGCLPGTQLFAGACWESSASTNVADAVSAAVSCGFKGGTLPSALELSAFAQGSGATLDAGGEWASDIVSFTSKNVFAVGTVTSDGAIDSAIFNSGGMSANRKFRCVIPLVK
ncbi:MAG: hypothetical protein WD827_04965 [Solirubrobacterales bacterium]